MITFFYMQKWSKMIRKTHDMIRYIWRKNEWMKTDAKYMYLYEYLGLDVNQVPIFLWFLKKANTTVSNIITYVLPILYALQCAFFLITR